MISEALAEKTRAWIRSAAILPSKATPDQRRLPPLGKPVLLSMRAAIQPKPSVRMSSRFRAGRHANLQLSCKSWEDALRSPAFVWMDYFLKIKAREDGHETPFSRMRSASGRTPGSAASSISPARSLQRPCPLAGKLSSVFAPLRRGTRSQIEQHAAKSGRRLPPWWISVWNQALYMADSLGRSVAELTGWQSCFYGVEIAGARGAAQQPR